MSDKFEHSFKLCYEFQPKDTRDYQYVSKLSTLPTAVSVGKSKIVCDKIAIPASFSLRAKMPAILNQGSLGTCVSNAFANAISFQVKTLRPSRLMHYDIARIMSNVVLSEDSGLYIRDACKALYYYGVCQETTWPYDESKLAVYPSLAALKACTAFRSFTYTFVNQDTASLKQCLNTNQTPIIFGITVYPSFMTNQVAKTGMVPLPNVSKETPQGGHCVLMVGYDDARSLFICANSWGTSWGDAGYFYLPYAYVSNKTFAGDFCYITVTQ